MRILCILGFVTKEFVETYDQRHGEAKKNHLSF